MEFVASSFDGVPVGYEVVGSGSLTVAFVPGLVGDHTDFSSQVDYFSGKYRTVGIDLPGSGESGQERSVWTMQALGEDVATVIHHIGVDRVVLVGHSLGGDATIEAALRLANRVSGLVWVSSFRSLDLVQSEEEMETWFAPFTMNFPPAMDDLNRRNFGSNADPGLVEAVTRRAREADQQRTMGLLRSKFNHQHGVVEAISHLDVPIFAINSDFKPNDEASFASHNVGLRTVPGVGHFVMLEDPETFNAELASVLIAFE